MSKYRQLAQFSIIVLEVVITPSIFGGGVFWLLRGNENQVSFSAAAAVFGLVIAFYRISLLNKKWSSDDHE